jgi:L-lysine exporter family protein LysE/ArgO
MIPGLATYFRGFLLGLGAAVPIGPVNVEIARRTLRSGFFAGFFLGCGAVTIDVICAILSSFGFAIISEQSWLFKPLQIIGGAFLAWLAFLCFRSAVRAMSLKTEVEQTPPPAIHASYITGLLMTGTNPYTLIFWFTAVPNAAGIGTQTTQSLPMICLGVFSATILWVLGFAGALKFAGRWRRQLWMLVADLFGGAMLAAFAFAAFWQAIK